MRPIGQSRRVSSLPASGASRPRPPRIERFTRDTLSKLPGGNDPATVESLVNLAQRTNTGLFAKAVSTFFTLHLGRAKPEAQDFLINLLRPKSSAEAELAEALSTSENIPLLASLPNDNLRELALTLRACETVPGQDAWQFAQDVVAGQLATKVDAHAVAQLRNYVDGDAMALATLPNDRLQLLVIQQDAIAETAQRRVKPLDVRAFARCDDPRHYLAKFAAPVPELTVLPAASKDFATIDELIASDAVYSEAYRTTLDSDGRQMLAFHMNRAAARAADLGQRVGLPTKLAQAVTAAAKVHDLGKLATGRQEDTNVVAAGEQLARVAQLDPEVARTVLQLIRYDELFGEILKGTQASKGSFRLTKFARTKIEQLERVFPGDDLRNALLVTFLADIQSKGVDLYTRWNVGPKLEFLGYGAIVTEAKR